MNELISKYVRNRLADSEKIELNKWLAKGSNTQRTLDEYHQIWRQSSHLRKEYIPDTESAWHQLQVELAKHTHVQSRFRYPWIAGFAASILLVGALLFIVSRKGSTTNFQALTEVKSPIELPDGSTVWINKNSDISFEEGEASRNIVLNGEAYFEVISNPNKPFTIRTGKLSTQVVGTSFNIDASDDDAIDVVVNSGRVLVFNEKDSVLLDPGEAGEYDLVAKTLKENNNVNQNYDAWRTGVLIFDDTPILEVIEILEEHFDTILVLDNTAVDVKLNGAFDNKSLDEILSVIELTTDIHIKSTNK